MVRVVSKDRSSGEFHTGERIKILFPVYLGVNHKVIVSDRVPIITRIKLL